MDSSIFDWAWRNDNLAFLRGTLSVDYVIGKLDQAAATLSDGPEVTLARRVANDAKTRMDVIEIRIDDLQENLSRLQREKDVGNSSAIEIGAVLPSWRVVLWTKAQRPR